MRHGGSVNSALRVPRRGDRVLHSENERILVTGAAGFIGSHLCRRLLDQGHEVIGLDNYFTGSKENIASLLPNPRFEMIRHDVTFPIYLEVDLIYNLACPASPVWYQKDPVQTLKTSVHGAINMLGLAKRVGARIIQASTSEVYGDPTLAPQSEDYWGNVNPVGPRSCYDEGKRAAETLFTDYRRQHGVDTRIVRIFNTYGPRMAFDDGRVVSNFILQALRGEPLTIYGSGEQTRSFCYVNDLVDGLMMVAGLESNPERPINLGNPQELSIRQLAEMVAEIVDVGLIEEACPLPIDDPQQRRPDISLMQSLTGWSPTFDVHKGLTLTIEDFRQRLN